MGRVRSPQEESARLLRMTEIEREYWSKNRTAAGMDEAGRGPLAGPVVVACVIMPPLPLVKYVDDSKRLSPNKRALLARQITETAKAYRTAFVSSGEIDDVNILNATRNGFYQAYNGLGVCADIVLCDYITGVTLHSETRFIKGGDALSYSIAAASIIAKTERDRYMLELHEKYPQYGFASNKGYGTAEHIAALREFGPCPEHRRTFIKKILGSSF